MANGMTTSKPEPQRVAFQTLGCRLNQFESDALGRVAREADYKVVDFHENADIYVINSCTITHEADADTRKQIRRARRQSPHAKIVVTGCYATAAPEEVRAIPEVDVVVGNDEKDQLFTILARKDHVQTYVSPINLLRRVQVARLRPAIDSQRSRAYLKIQDGCNYRCSFCIVPQVRGRSSSLSPDIVLDQLAELVDAGIPEIVLTGVHLGTYGWDLEPRIKLKNLLIQMLPRLQSSRLRLGSLDPHEVDSDLITLLAENSHSICRYLHLPVQSGDDRTLKRMRRAHSAADLSTLAACLVKTIPGICLGTDLIVGFPGESEQEFSNSYDLLDSLPLAYMHVFSYSSRQHTDAATMEEQNSPEEKIRRNAIMRELSQKKSKQFRDSQVGQLLSAVVHRHRDRKTGNLVALTDNYIKVMFSGEDRLLGQRIHLRICESGANLAKGELLAD